MDRSALQMISDRRILLIGRQGQVGFELRRALSPLGTIIAVGRSECDLADPQAIRALIRDTKPHAVVNAAAYTAVDRAENEEKLAYAINATAPEILSIESAAVGAFLIHYSTDYVFDGNKDSPYLEEDSPNPLNVYGRSKLAGEQAIQGSGADHLIFRTSWVVGLHGANFLKTMLRLAAERDSLNVVADQIGAPTSAALIADITAHALRDKFSKREMGLGDGIYHLSASGVTNWHEYAYHIIERARATGYPIRVPADGVVAISAKDYPAAAKRPMNSWLATDKICHALGISLPKWYEGVDYILDQLLSAYQK